MTDIQSSRVIEQDPTEAWLADMEQEIEAARLSNESEQTRQDSILETAARELEEFTQGTQALLSENEGEVDEE